MQQKHHCRLRNDLNKDKGGCVSEEQLGRLLCGNLKRSDVVLRYVETCWYGAVSDLEDDWDLITLFSRDMHGSIELSLWYADCCWDNGSRQSWLIWTRFSVRNNKYDSKSPIVFSKGAFKNYVCILWHFTTNVPPLVCTFYVVNVAFVWPLTHP